MKTLSLRFIIIMFVAGLTAANSVKAAQTLLWSDEFNGTSVDTNYWDVWDAADGSDSWYAPKNVSVANGILTIQNHEELYNGKHWTGGKITSKLSSSVFHPKYGYIEAKVRFTVNQCYVWGAWWADGWANGLKVWPPEFDIMEYYGGPQNTPYFHYYSGSWSGNSLGVSDESVWHTYGMYWDANTAPISYMDGHRLWQTSDNSSVKNIALFLQISCSPSLKVRYSGCPLGDMQVDYVRFYDVAPDMTGGGGIVSGGIYRLAPKIASTKALDATAPGTADGTQMQIWDWYATSNQEYQITDVGGGYYKLVPQSATNPAKALDVNAAGSADGTKIQLWQDNGTSAQKWQIVDMGGGFYKLQPQCAPNSCLDIKSSGTANGTIVQLYHDNSTDAQRWSLQKQ